MDRYMVEFGYGENNRSHRNTPFGTYYITSVTFFDMNGTLAGVEPRYDITW
jgi:hypothetical protein